MHALGMGIFQWADVVLGALDNRETRLWINRASWRMNRPWIDGAIEGINGVVRVFLPGEPPCYECTLGDIDWQILQRRMSCNLLTREEMDTGKVPTTPTTSSVIAGIQVQEALKLLHGLPVLAGKGYIFEGMNHTSYVVEYTPNDDCMSHDIYKDIHLWSKTSAETKLSEIHNFAQDILKSDDVIVEFSRDIIQALQCPRCGRTAEVYSPVGSLSTSQGYCPEDGEMRQVIAIHGYTGSEPFGEMFLTELGLPLFDVLIARTQDREIQVLMDADSELFLRACYRNKR